MRRLAFLTTLLALWASVQPAASGVGDWFVSEAVEIRLAASARGVGETPVAVLEIVLQPGWKTYWRTPGEGGLRPTLDFSRSRNVAAALIRYPAPHRYDDGFSITNVYEGRVIIPIELSPEVPSSPITVHLRFDLGVCETICFPLQVETSVTFSPNRVDDLVVALFEEGARSLPSSSVPNLFEIVQVDLIAVDETRADFKAVAVVPQPFGSELFVEGPIGWLPNAPQQIGRDGNRLTYTFGFDRLGPAIPLAGAALTFTLVSAGAAIEQTIILQ